MGSEKYRSGSSLSIGAPALGPSSGQRAPLRSQKTPSGSLFALGDPPRRAGWARRGSLTSVWGPNATPSWAKGTPPRAPFALFLSARAGFQGRLTSLPSSKAFTSLSSRSGGELEAALCHHSIPPSPQNGPYRGVEGLVLSLEVTRVRAFRLKRGAQSSPIGGKFASSHL